MFTNTITAVRAIETFIPRKSMVNTLCRNLDRAPQSRPSRVYPRDTIGGSAATPALGAPAGPAAYPAPEAVMAADMLDVSPMRPPSSTRAYAGRLTPMSTATIGKSTRRPTKSCPASPAGYALYFRSGAAAKRGTRDQAGGWNRCHRAVRHDVG